MNQYDTILLNINTQRKSVGFAPLLWYKYSSMLMKKCNEHISSYNWDIYCNLWQLFRLNMINHWITEIPYLICDRTYFPSTLSYVKCIFDKPYVCIYTYIWICIYIYRIHITYIHIIYAIVKTWILHQYEQCSKTPVGWWL